MAYMRSRDDLPLTGYPVMFEPALEHHPRCPARVSAAAPGRTAACESTQPDSRRLCRVPLSRCKQANAVRAPARHTHCTTAWQPPLIGGAGGLIMMNRIKTLGAAAL